MKWKLSINIHTIAIDIDSSTDVCIMYAQFKKNFLFVAHVGWCALENSGWCNLAWEIKIVLNLGM